MPLVRDVQASKYKQEEVKYVFEKQEESTKTIVIQDENGKETKTKETSTFTKHQKKTLKCYGNTAEEDSECFFEAFERFQSEMQEEWDDANKNMGNDATSLFNGMDHMLIHTANTEWHDVLAQHALRNWEEFKKTVAQYITEKVLPDDAHEKQVTYMNERKKPRGLEAKQWYLRLQTLNRYLPYFLGSMTAVKALDDTATFPKWWIVGGLSPFDLKKIVKNNAPDSWQRQLKLNTVGSTNMTKLTAADIIGYYGTLETFEAKGKRPAIRTPAGRTGVNRRQGPGDRYQSRPQVFERRPFGGNNQRYNNNHNYQRYNNQRRNPQSGSQGRGNYATGGQQQRQNPKPNNDKPQRIEGAYFGEERPTLEIEDSNDTLQQEEEEYAAWSDVYSEQHHDNEDFQEEEDTEDDAEDNFMFNEAFDFRYGG
jgi:hypothetical protein